MKTIALLITILVSHVALAQQVTIERNLNLELVEKDSLASLKIENALNGFLTEAQEKKYSEKYVDSTHLLKYEFFFNKLAGIGKNAETFNKPLVLKSYPIENGIYRLTIGFTGQTKEQPFIYQITELKAVPYEEHYRFYCVFEENTKHFNTKIFDNVTYHYSNSINETTAKKFVDFTQEFAKLTKAPIPQLDYYSFNSLDELLKSYGFLYSARQCNFLCYDLGFMDNGGKTYITGMNNENYNSDYVAEYIYNYLPNTDELYWPFLLGVSAYYGGYFTTYDNMSTMKAQFRQELVENPNIDFLEERTYPYNG